MSPLFAGATHAPPFSPHGACGETRSPKNATRFLGCPACLALFPLAVLGMQGNACVAPTKDGPS